MKSQITMSKQTDLSIEEAFKLFLRKAKVRNLRENTIKTYSCHFLSFAKCVDITQPISTITQDTIDNFILYMRSECGVKDISINSYLRTIRVFLYYCMECNYINSFKIKMPKVDKPLKETYSDDELDRLLKKLISIVVPLRNIKHGHLKIICLLLAIVFPVL